MIVGEDLFVFFYELVRSSVRTSESTVFYVSRMLADVRGLDEGPFGTRLLSSREPTVLRSVGDGSLFISGFFPERIVYRGMSKNYYAQVGSTAYSVLADIVPKSARDLYEELSQSFPHLQRALEGVRERCDAMGMDAGDAAMKWLQTGSPILERRLTELGWNLSGRPAQKS